MTPATGVQCMANSEGKPFTIVIRKVTVLCAFIVHLNGRLAKLYGCNYIYQ